MKKIKLYISLLLGVFLVASCELDNYDAPNAKIYGGIYDNVTGELIPQDIISGSRVEYIELGYPVPTTQYLILKSDGSFRNDLMFSGKYAIGPGTSGNYVTPAKDTIDLATGETKLDFTVQPFVRIKNCTITKVGTEVVATFNIEQTTTDKVRYITLFASREPSLGASFSQVNTRSEIDVVTVPATVYTIKINLSTNSTTLIPGRDFYFRVGAQSRASGAKYNYAPAIVKITV